MIALVAILGFLLLLPPYFKTLQVAAGLQDNAFTSDSNCKDYFKGLPSTSPISALTFTSIVRNGFYECVKDIIAMYSANNKILDNYSLKDVFDTESRFISKELNGIKTLIDNTYSMKIVHPAFQWAQSVNELFLNVKFSHKIDAPATLNVEPSNVSLSDTGYLYLDANDKKSKRFLLNVEFFGAIDNSSSTHQLASVGRMTFTIKKAIPGVWKRLLKSDKAVKYMYVWWDKQEQYNNEIDAFTKISTENAKTKDATNTTIEGEKNKNNTTSSAGVIKAESKKISKHTILDNSDDGDDVEMEQEEVTVIKNRYDTELDEIKADLLRSKKELESKHREERKILEETFTLKRKETENKMNAELKEL